MEAARLFFKCCEGGGCHVRLCDVGGTDGGLTHFVLALISLIWTVCARVVWEEFSHRLFWKRIKEIQSWCHFFNFWVKKKRKLQIPVWKLTHSSCACGQPACRTGLELFWAGVQTLRNYHWAWFSNVTELLWESCFTWWSSRPPRGLRPATPADDIKSSIPVCLLTCWDKELQCLLSVWNSAASFLLHS